jgi:hypothetical protein
MRVNLGNSVVLTKCFSDDQMKDDFWGTEVRKSVYSGTECASLCTVEKCASLCTVEKKCASLCAVKY